jgi:hypothetical protein
MRDHRSPNSARRRTAQTKHPRRRASSEGDANNGAHRTAIQANADYDEVPTAGAKARTEADEAMTATWEYRTETGWQDNWTRPTGHTEQGSEALKAIFTDLGNDGWELVQIVDLGKGPTAVFKRAGPFSD